MQLRSLGRTGMHVSPLCLGTMMFGAWGEPDHAKSIEVIHAALDAGINFVDTADVYSQGESEEIVAKALVDRRDDVILATKFHLPMDVPPGQPGGNPNMRGNSRRWIVRAVEDSLRRLGTDWIDLYQVHRPDPDTEIEETLSALTDLRQQGKIRAFGTSTFPAHELVEAQWTSDRRGLGRFSTEQPPYSALVRGIEADVLPVAERYGLGVLTWSPLAAGWLSGRVKRDDENLESSRKARTPQRYDLSVPGNRAKRDAALQLADLADQAGLTMIELALGFTLAHPAVTSTIIGPRTLEQLRSQIGAHDVRLTATCSTGSTRSCRPGSTSTPATVPTCRRRSPIRGSVAVGRTDGTPLRSDRTEREAVLRYHRPARARCRCVRACSGSRLRKDFAAMPHVRILIRPKAGILDPQGTAVEQALPQLGFAGVSNVHVGRLVELDVTTTDELEAMCQKLLANPLVEDYEIQIDPPAAD